MQLNMHPKSIIDHESWKQACPPKKGDLQWAEGRSAMELAKYMTKQFPAVPAELEQALKALVPADTRFDWDAEYVTALPGKGEGRNHDAVLFCPGLVATVEAKADETLGGLVKEEMQNASVNKLCRITKLLGYLFDDGFKAYHDLRYQLITASVGTILEAEKRSADTAVLFVVVFKTDKTEERKIAANQKDVAAFLDATNAYGEKGFKVIPNKTGVKLYFKEILI